MWCCRRLGVPAAARCMLWPPQVGDGTTSFARRPAAQHTCATTGDILRYVRAPTLMQLFGTGSQISCNSLSHSRTGSPVNSAAALEEAHVHRWQPQTCPPQAHSGRGSRGCPTMPASGTLPLLCRHHQRAACGTAVLVGFTAHWRQQQRRRQQQASHSIESPTGVWHLARLAPAAR